MSTTHTTRKEDSMKLSTRDSQGIADAIKANKPFATHGSLSGKPEAPWSNWHTGRLPEQYIESALAADYVIYSYATPIAWRTNGQWVQPPVKYSVTTSRQQSTVADAIARLTRVPNTVNFFAEHVGASAMRA